MMLYLKTLKRYIFIALDSNRNEAFMIVPFLITIFAIGTNFNRQLIPGYILLPVSIALSLVGIASYAAFIYWTIFFWSKFPTERRILTLIKSIIYTFMFALALGFTYAILY